MSKAPSRSRNSEAITSCRLYVSLNRYSRWARVSRVLWHGLKPHWASCRRCFSSSHQESCAVTSLSRNLPVQERRAMGLYEGSLPGLRTGRIVEGFQQDGKDPDSQLWLKKWRVAFQVRGVR